MKNRMDIRTIDHLTISDSSSDTMDWTKLAN